MDSNREPKTYSPRGWKLKEPNNIGLDVSDSLYTHRGSCLSAYVNACAIQDIYLTVARRGGYAVDMDISTAR